MFPWFIYTAIISKFRYYNSKSSRGVLLKRYQIILIIGALFFSIGYFSCSLSSFSQEQIQEIKSLKQTQTTVSTLQNIINKKQLDVVILNSPTVYYKGAHTTRGFEYDLISDYAKSIGVDLNLTVVHTITEALKLSKDGVGDITVASITVTDARKKEYNFGPQYFTIQEQLICNNKLYRKKTFPKSEEDLVGLSIVVGAGTSYEQTIKKLKQEVDLIEYKITKKYSSEELLSKVAKNQINCTIVDSNVFMINQGYYPELSKSLILSDRRNLAWILRDGDGSFKSSLYKWLNSYDRSGQMDELKDFYFAYIGIFDYFDTTTFFKRIKSTLPKYKKYFIQAAKKYDLPWVLLAAQSYQESHWNPRAKSHTGVRGIMMITRTTAKQLGVKNRLNAKENIYGGAKYLAKLEKRLDKKITGKSRWAFTLAAYNVGMGHIHDAQILARKLNRNPYLWSDIKEILPLLSQRKYFRHAQHGYARGGEPVRYVDSILQYSAILEKKEMGKY